MAKTSKTAGTLIGRFLADSRGATAIEYSMVAAGVAGAVVLTVYSLGSTVSTNFFDKIVTAWGAGGN